MLKRIVGLTLIAVAGLIVWIWLRRHQDDFATMSTQFAPPDLSVRPASTPPQAHPTSKPASSQAVSTLVESPPAAEEHATSFQEAEAPAPLPAPAPAKPQPDTSAATAVAPIEAGDDGAAEEPEPEQPAVTTEDTTAESEPEAEPEPEQPALTADDTATESEPDPSEAELDASESDLDEVTGYCVRCKTKRTISDAHEETTESGRRAARGTCPVCGANMFTFLKDEP